MPKGEAESSAFKHRISPEAIGLLGGLLADAWPAFPRQRFAELATRGLEGLELKARVAHVAAALGETLPDDFPEAARVIEGALESPELDGWIAYPVDDFVAAFGIEHPQVALPLMGELTSRWSCEFAIRPFVERWPEETMAQLWEWTRSPDEHRRRLVSEGTRPRLPWASRLNEFVADPSPTIRLLDALVDDESEYVRRSVANHLNDVAKDHPELAVETAERWVAEDPGSERRRWIAGHAMRSLVKAGDPRALRLLGFEPDAAVAVEGFAVEPERVAIGGTVELGFTLSAAQETPVMVDYLVHHAGSRGARAPKVFKLARRTLVPGRPERIVRAHRFREVSVRRLYPGPHLVELQVNGRVLAARTVELLPSGESEFGS